MMKLSTALITGLMVSACSDAYGGSGYGNSYESSDLVQVSGNTVLTASNGMTLYTFDRDSKGVSNCYNDCADSWPPYVASANASAPAAGFSKVERNDGTLQWAKNGAPLYFWVGDTKPGDANGDGVGGVWHVAH